MRKCAVKFTLRKNDQISWRDDVNTRRQHYVGVAAADIKNDIGFVELLRRSRVSTFYDKFAMFRDEASRRDP